MSREFQRRSTLLSFTLDVSNRLRGTFANVTRGSIAIANSVDGPNNTAGEIAGVTSKEEDVGTSTDR